MIMPASVQAQKDTSKEVKIATDQQKIFCDLAALAINEEQIGNRPLADSMLRLYETNYLDTLCDSMLFSQQNLRFISGFPELIRSGDRVFNLFYESPELADEIIGARKGYAGDVVKYIIQKEEIDVYLYKYNQVITNNPHWGQMFRRITAKYNQQYAELLTQPAEFKFYRKTGNWRKYASLFERKIRQQRPTQESNGLGGGFGDSWTLNTTAWDMFLYCNNRSVLKMAVKWSDLSISLCKTEPDAVQYFDTKANLLYKLGKQALAVQYEQKALALSNKSKEYESNLDKMKARLPTWPVK